MHLINRFPFLHIAHMPRVVRRVAYVVVLAQVEVRVRDRDGERADDVPEERGEERSTFF